MRRLIAGSILLGIVFVFLAIAAVPDRAEAIPAFSREHNAPCTMCHVAFPKLNSFGIDFKQRGYRMEGQEGTSVWESKSIPLAGMVMFKYVNTDEETTTTASTKTSLIELDEVEFFAAGTLGPRVSYFMDFASEEGLDFAPGLAFIILDDLLPDSLLNLKAGKYDAEFPFLSDARRLTLRPYVVKISSSTSSATTTMGAVTTNEGVSLTKAGAEINGVHPAGFRYALGVGNDNAVNTDNNVTAIYAWATQTFAGQTIGLLYSSDRTGNDAATANTDDRVSTIGGTVDLHFGPANMLLGYFSYKGNDKISTVEGDINSVLAELYYSISPQLEGVARYNYADNDDTNEKDTEYVLHLGYYFLPNASLGLEYSKRTDDSGTTELDTDKIQAAVHFGF